MLTRTLVAAYTNCAERFWHFEENMPCLAWHQKNLMDVHNEAVQRCSLRGGALQPLPDVGVQQGGE